MGEPTPREWYLQARLGIHPVSVGDRTAILREDISKNTMGERWEIAKRWNVELGAVCVTGVIGAVAATAGVGIPPFWRFAPLAVSAVLFGMSHGAVDDRSVRDAVRGDPAGGSSVDPGVSRLAVFVLYAILGVFYAALWAVAPIAAVALFIALTWFHWGQGDLYHLLASRSDTHLRTRFVRALTLFVRGGLPMLVPLVAFPAVYRRVVTAFVHVFRPNMAVSWPFDGIVRVGLGVGFALVTAGTFALGRRYATSPERAAAWRRDAAETVVLWIFFLTIPPLVAIGIYFTWWHAIRHVRRVLALDGCDDVRRVTLERLDRSRLIRFSRLVFTNTVGGLAVFAAIAVFVGTNGGLLRLAAIYLVAIAILTLPHAVVVTWLDVVQGVWRTNA